jgi:pimeloyl-ACP methyl ester carboxylesterase
MEQRTLNLPDGRRIAYRRSEGRGPGLVFLGGLRSDMTGTKADFLHDWAAGHGRAFLRFDYTGHGASSGRFEDGCIGDWARDAADALARLTSGAQIVVGSSMGGWVGLLLARRMPERFAGLVGIAAAPDFTEDLMWAGLDPAGRRQIETSGRIELPSDYDEAPTVITRRMIEDGRANLVLRTPLALPFPVRLLHGSADADVPVSLALRLLEHAECRDLRLTIVRGADHRFSRPDNLELLAATVSEMPDIVA